MKGSALVVGSTVVGSTVAGSTSNDTFLQSLSGVGAVEALSGAGVEVANNAGYRGFGLLEGMVSVAGVDADRSISLSRVDSEFGKIVDICCCT
jgi:hypothetical protein